MTETIEISLDMYNDLIGAKQYQEMLVNALREDTKLNYRGDELVLDGRTALVVMKAHNPTSYKRLFDKLKGDTLAEGVEF